MGYLWFDPRAAVVKNDPPYKPVDPSRPIRKRLVAAPVAQEEAIGWPMFGVAVPYVAPDSDPA
jgi:hypothetical protein